MLFYFILAVRTCATKYSRITVQRKYVGRDMLICHDNRQFGLRNIMFTCALVHGSSRKNLKMSDVSDDSYLYAVAAVAASVVLTVDITIRRLKKRHTCVGPLLRSRSEVGDLLLPELGATDTRMYANFTRLSPAEFIFLLCAIREQITGSDWWHRPIPLPVCVTYWSRMQAGRRDWLQQFQLMNISLQCFDTVGWATVRASGL